jgi:hypothetical protein
MADVEPMDVLAETDNYTAYQVVEQDGEITFHLDMGGVTMHLFREEWEEFLALVDEVIAKRNTPRRK